MLLEQYRLGLNEEEGSTVDGDAQGVTKREGDAVGPTTQPRCSHPGAFIV